MHCVAVIVCTYVCKLHMYTRNIYRDNNIMCYETSLQYVPRRFQCCSTVLNGMPAFISFKAK